MISGSFHKGGYPLKWMVCREHPIKMDHVGVPPFVETPICHIYPHLFIQIYIHILLFISIQSVTCVFCLGV